MKTKYNVSLENTFIGPISAAPDSLLKEMAGNFTGNNNNVNKFPSVFSSPTYECWMKSPIMGALRLYAGHHKHTFCTFSRSITCRVIEGQIKVKYGSQRQTVTKNTIIKLSPNTRYYVKNNSLHRECLVEFIFEEM
ncbi:uncharacterized protein LOC116342339 [Contarinia nasturtii]|uniref:uncharacterized protein LOC116342339 n=1 Tax=Contarinia nasturtii TaxID=265458 RepID=UPI0012D43B41|nr:uncharacterized protein LOC116342339 [Contarinia nasturtii]